MYRLYLRGKTGCLLSKREWREIYENLNSSEVELYSRRARRAARRGKTQRVFFSGSGYVYPHLDDIHALRTNHYGPITTDQALWSKHCSLSTTLQDGKNTTLSDLEQSGGH